MLSLLIEDMADLVFSCLLVEQLVLVLGTICSFHSCDSSRRIGRLQQDDHGGLVPADVFLLVWSGWQQRGRALGSRLDSAVFV